MSVPRWLRYLLGTLVVLSWIPLVLIAHARLTTSAEPRLHLVPDMDDQPKLRAQAATRLFADRRAMRPPVAGTVARGALSEEDAFYRGRIGSEWVGANPLPVTVALLEHGRARFAIYCAPCHGLAGYGDGPVSRRAQELEDSAWIPPASFHTDQVRGRADGHIFNTISNGLRNMPAYGAQVEVADRWAIVAYVRALQRSQDAAVGDVPVEEREALAGEGAR